ncbi:tRNA uridine(34) 5-carboxymethylaminomethyl modification radical SAM/GNAT enzyme Elp3 [Candidatus Falkowbacteria bacterium]|nr:tRNA uridine(34) 5-carboxymethylaminomethyl modification radical SAM/GNAT enzyme Elp3 [Candidatus Falkowbacteria bacterium]
MLAIHQTILQELASQNLPLHEKEVVKIIRKHSKKAKIAPPSKKELLISYHTLVDNKSIEKNLALEDTLKKREIRTLSGVAPIAVLTKPYFCPGKCAFCPTETRMPKSYLSNEPAVMRAVLNKWDPYDQVVSRLKAYKANGHDTSKCEFIVIGGTWSFLPKRYQSWFIKRLFDGLNGFTATSLAKAQKFNETAQHRAVGLCLETRPDYITTQEVIRMRELGCTRVEIGLQSTDVEVLKLNKRGHGVETVRRATRLLRDAGFKISYHLMPNLPGATPDKDIQTFRDTFNDPGLKPDMVKIYPCVVVKDAEIYDWWKNGTYKPYDDETLFNTLIECKKFIPTYCRVTRLIRDIPTTSVYAGNMRANLRQDILQHLQKINQPCRCIRCREPKHQEVDPNSITLTHLAYETEGGTEYFISYESKDNSTLFGFVRLRLPFDISKKITSKLPALKKSALIRELHVYGAVVPINSQGNKVQHKGLGTRLMHEAEKIAAQHGYNKISVISGIGVRKYYEKLGYHQESTYMTKTIR